MKYSIIQKNDIKSILWASEFRGSQLVCEKYSQIFSFSFLVYSILSRRKLPESYIFRYLNDYPSLPRTLARLLSEILVIITCLILDIKVVWICHNLDRESLSNWRRISLLRRGMMCRFSTKVCVTHPLLVSKALVHIPVRASKLDYVTFGRTTASTFSASDQESKAIDFIEKKKAEAIRSGKIPLVTFCASTPESYKVLHYEYLSNLILHSLRSRYMVISILAGDFLSTKRGVAFYEKLSHEPSVLLFPYPVIFTSSFIQRYVDFYWRGYLDVSVPYSLYESVSNNKPILAIDSGFLPQIVRHFNLGTVLPEGLCGIDEVLASVSSPLSKHVTQSFFEEHSWNSLFLVVSNLR